MGRIHWPSMTLRAAGVIALVAVEAAVATVLATHVEDPLSRTILTAAAVLCGLGVALGPSVAVSLRKGPQRFWACVMIAICIVGSAWNLSTQWANVDQHSMAATITSAASYPADLTRLAALNRMVDALSDERDDYTLGNTIAERDRLQERLDKANPAPVVVAGLIYWIKAGIFHALIAACAAVFVVPIRPARRAAKKAAKATPENVVDLFGSKQSA